ncbi:hypothetical protein DFJ74DRAFT_671979 [Hyaloraphidium curvatum]|nr:hypothetical protein DFJ74DRAFT_671979 [Hyaloraphidium curvatum]
MASVRLLLVAVLALAVARGVESHSWVACTDYAERNGYYWNATKCRGYPRGAAGNVFNVAFGQNVGFESRSAACRAADANPSYPIASYRPGQQVCLTWSAQNHVNCAGLSGCNIWLPDGGIIVEVGPTPTGPWTLVGDLGRSTFGNNFNPAFPRPGFQNCPNFDPSGTGRIFPIGDQSVRAFCSNCFRLPSDFAPGSYVFRWRWEFNSGENYWTCWDATVSAGSPPPDPPEFVVPGTPPPPPPPPSPPPPPPPATTPRPIVPTTSRPIVPTTSRPAVPTTTRRPAATTSRVAVPTTAGPKATTTRRIATTSPASPPPPPPPSGSTVRLYWTQYSGDAYGINGEVSLENLGANNIDGYSISYVIKPGYTYQPGWAWNCGSVEPPTEANGRRLTCTVNAGAWNGRIAAGSRGRTFGTYVFNPAGQGTGRLADATEGWRVVVGGVVTNVGLPVI